MKSGASGQGGPRLTQRLFSTQTIKLAELRLFDSFCTPIEERFERITRLGKRALCTPIVAITTVTENMQWFNSAVGWSVVQLPVAESLCSRTIAKGKPVVVPDLCEDPKYADHPLVVGAPNFRSYAGVPIRDPEGTIAGTFCAIDTKPREMSKDRYQALLDLAELAQREMMTNVLQNAQSAILSRLSIARRQALIDPMTKTWNRRGGKLLLAQCLKDARKHGYSIAVLAVDVDRFKAINDKFGHPTGDRVLRMVARELLGCVREDDGVCRFGGDEFLVVMNDVNAADAETVVRRVSRRIAKNVINVDERRTATVTVSIGTSFVDADSEQSADEIVAAADSALYKNKRTQSAFGI